MIWDVMTYQQAELRSWVDKEVRAEDGFCGNHKSEYANNSMFSKYPTDGVMALIEEVEGTRHVHEKVDESLDPEQNNNAKTYNWHLQRLPGPSSPIGLLFQNLIVPLGAIHRITELHPNPGWVIGHYLTQPYHSRSLCFRREIKLSEDDGFITEVQLSQL